MSPFLRVWQQFDIKDIEQHLLVIGELSGECYNCHKIGLQISSQACPQCQARFKYMGFRRKINPSSIPRFKEMHPRLICIDFDDFKKVLSKKEARRLLDI